MGRQYFYDHPYVLYMALCLSVVLPQRLRGSESSQEAKSLCPNVDFYSTQVSHPISEEAMNLDLNPVPLSLADGCDEYDPAIRNSILDLSCYTTYTSCFEGQSPINCGKRALMNGDWRRALEQFQKAAEQEETCEAVYGRFLARLFQLGSHWANRFFADGFNRRHVLIATLNPLLYASEQPPVEYFKEYACLVLPEQPNWLGFPCGPHLCPDQYGAKSLLDQDLEFIWENDCTLTGPNDLPGMEERLPIRYMVAGVMQCEDPLLDQLLLAKWDKADAFFMYEHIWGSPIDTKRFLNGATLVGILTDRSSSLPCEDYAEPGTPIYQACLHVTRDIEVHHSQHTGALQIPRLSPDTEWAIIYKYATTQELFNPQRDASKSLFFWEDVLGDGLTREDRVRSRICYDSGIRSNQPAYNLSRSTIAGTWSYEEKPYPSQKTSTPKTYIYCGEGSYSGDKDGCAQDPDWVMTDEIALDEEAPYWLKDYGEPYTQSFSRGAPMVPDPTGRYIALARPENGEIHNPQGGPARWDLYVTDNQEDPNNPGTPLCKGKSGIEDCCLTCGSNLFPAGIEQSARINYDPTGHDSMGVYPFWIANPENPQEMLGLLFQHNNHLNAFGNMGVAMGTDLYAVSLKKWRGRHTFSRLLPSSIPLATLHYHYRLSQDGSKVIWTSTWDPSSDSISGHRMLMADLEYDPLPHRFQLKNIHSVIPTLDNGWYEVNSFEYDEENRRIYFTNTSKSWGTTRLFFAEIDPSTDLATKIWKVDWPGEGPEDCFEERNEFQVDCHPAWNEHLHSIGGDWAVFVTSDDSGSAAERIEMVLDIPPYLESVLMGGLVNMHLRFVGGLNIGYLQKMFWSITKLDGTGRAPMLQSSFGKWKPILQETPTPEIHYNTAYFIQTQEKDHWWEPKTIRYGFIKAD